jgi:hypothetical protein
MAPKGKEKLVPLTVWIPASLKADAVSVVEEHGDITRMVKAGLKKEIAIRKVSQTGPEAKAS